MKFPLDLKILLILLVIVIILNAIFEAYRVILFIKLRKQARLLHPEKNFGNIYFSRLTSFWGKFGKESWKIKLRFLPWRFKDETILLIWDMAGLEESGDSIINEKLKQFVKKARFYYKVMFIIAILGLLDVTYLITKIYFL